MSGSGRTRPGEIVFISKISACRLAVEDTLKSEHSEVALAFKGIIGTDKDGTLVLALMGTLDGDVYIFDIKKRPDLMTDGQLWRIFVSTDIVKVMHDCRKSSLALRQQFNITLRNVFDTQAAYSLLMMQSHLPPRLIDLKKLHEKFGETEQRQMYESLEYEQAGIFWAQRPLSKEMLMLATSDVNLLIPAVYANMKRKLSTIPDTMEDLCKSFVLGTYQVKYYSQPPP